MSLSGRLSTSLSIIAAALLALGMFAMAPAFASAASGCHIVQAPAQAPPVFEEGPTVSDSRSCCTQMHCCPIVPVAPLATLPNPFFDPPRTNGNSDRPLLLVEAIDPPPRFRSV